LHIEHHVEKIAIFVSENTVAPRIVFYECSVNRLPCPITWDAESCLSAKA